MMVSVAIDGSTTTDVKISPLLILYFNFPPMSSTDFYAGSMTERLAIVLGVPSNKIQTVNIVSEANPM